MLRRVGATLHRYAGPLKVLSAALLLAALLVLARVLPLDELLARLAGEVDALGPWGPALFGAAFVVCAVALLPITPLTLIAGALFGPLGGLAVVSAASTLAAAVSFFLGRRLGRAAPARYAGRFRRVAAVYRALGAAGWKLVAAVRLSHAGSFGLQNVLLGMTPVRFRPYLLATWAAMLPGTLLYAYLGHLLGLVALRASGARLPPVGPWGWALRGLTAAAIAAAVLYVGRLVRRALQDSAAHDLADSGLPPALAERPVPSPTGWPWGTALLLLAGAFALTGAAWAWLAQERLRDLVGHWLS
jgi:uncharacterized membrane protein YdjX (TVP38/TMEM64 family)